MGPSDSPEVVSAPFTINHPNVRLPFGLGDRPVSLTHIDVRTVTGRHTVETIAEQTIRARIPTLRRSTVEEAAIDRVQDDEILEDALSFRQIRTRAPTRRTRAGGHTLQAIINQSIRNPPHTLRRLTAEEAAVDRARRDVLLIRQTRTRAPTRRVLTPEPEEPRTHTSNRQRPVEWNLVHQRPLLSHRQRPPGADPGAAHSMSPEDSVILAHVYCICEMKKAAAVGENASAQIRYYERLLCGMSNQAERDRRQHLHQYWNTEFQMAREYRHKPERYRDIALRKMRQYGIEYWSSMIQRFFSRSRLG